MSKTVSQFNPSKSEVERSKVNRFGSQYYEVDQSYDKRVYENTGKNWALIVIALIIFWFFQALHWWGVFEFGISNA